MKVEIEICDWCKGRLSENEFQNHREGNDLVLCCNCGDLKAFGEGYSRAIARLGSVSKVKEAMKNLLLEYGHNPSNI